MVFPEKFSLAIAFPQVNEALLFSVTAVKPKSSMIAYSSLRYLTTISKSADTQHRLPDALECQVELSCILYVEVAWWVVQFSFGVPCQASLKSDQSSRQTKGTTRLIFGAKFD